MAQAGPRVRTAPTAEERLLAEAALDVVLQWRGWVHRRVESLHPLPGDRGRQRHSIDCTPPPDPRLAYEPAERAAASITAVRGLVIVPLLLVKKEPMRELDVVDAEGTPIPVLGMRENADLAAGMLLHALAKEQVEVTDELRDVIDEVVAPPGHGRDPVALATRLVETGGADGRTYWSPAALSAATESLLRDLATHFVLAGVLPAGRVGLRQVLKLAYHWDTTDPSARGTAGPDKPLSRADALRIAVGLRPALLTVPLNGASDTASYHLEFQTPPQLRCRRLALPAGHAGRTDGPATDTSGLSVAHAHATYDRPPRDRAKVELTVPATGMWAVACATAVFTAAVAVATLLFQGARDRLIDESGGASGIIVALPALVVGLALATSESTLTTRLLRPLRQVTITSCAILLLMAASLVGSLHRYWFDVLWWAAAAWGVSLVALFAVGWWTRRSDARAMSAAEG